MRKEYVFTELFRQFISDSKSGRRLKPDGHRIKPQTVKSYEYVLNLVKDFCSNKAVQLRIMTSSRPSKQEIRRELRYWKKFYREFSEYLYKERNCYDNYVGGVFKTIRTFFNYLKKDKLLAVGEIHRYFYVHKEEVPIVTLMPHQLQFLINDKEFESSLSSTMKRTRDFFVFGCTVALRYSDLFNIRFRDIEEITGQFYLVVKSVKTNFITRIKLPVYAVEIIKKNRKKKSENSKVFTRICLSQINKNIRKLAELCGWTYAVGKTRKRNGRDAEHLTKEHKAYRFCDLLSSHSMRRTAITTMLMLGMHEHVVRKISGHTLNSKAFYRYVNFVQSYLDQEIDKVHAKLAAA